MRIKKLKIWQQEFILKEPYTIAYETIDRCTNIFLEVETTTGFTGFGCAAPDLSVTKETPQSVSKAFHEVIEPQLKGTDPFNYIRTLDHIKKSLRHQPSALAMIDMVLYDLVSKKAHVPLYKYLGGFRASIRTSVTIGIMPERETILRAKEFVQQGFRAIKIKGGKDVREDIARVRAVSEILKDDSEIRFDANQGYTADEAIHFINETKHTKLKLLEQPTSAQNENLLGLVARNVPVPVMADESIKSLKDVFRLTRRDLTDMINIKLMKVGGLTEGLHINSVAKAAGVEVMVGCMDESALAISAGLHFALARPNIIYADLDSFLDITNDPYSSAIILKDGVLYPNKKPGLGV